MSLLLNKNMLNIVREYVKRNISTVSKNMLLNCHVKNLHSVVLKNDGKISRLFISNSNHLMKHNFMSNILNGYKMTVGFHSHHCNLKIYPLIGNFYNIVAEKNNDSICNTITLDSYKFVSHIKTNSGIFEQLNTKQSFLVKEHKYEANTSYLFLNSKELHSVACDGLSVWLIEEEDEDYQYNSECYSNDALTNFDFKSHYIKASQYDAIEILRKSGILQYDYDLM